VFADNVALVNFWVPGRDEQETLLPVVWWRRDPNQYTHRYEWAFPRETILGEALFLIDEQGEWFPFEIRVRQRELGTWYSSVYRPFLTAGELADALGEKRKTRDDWAADPSISALIATLQDPGNLEEETLSASHFAGAFDPIDGAVDDLPGVSDPTILKELLREATFQSVEGSVWKESGGLRAFAPTTDASFHVVPRNYNGGLLEVSQENCHRCHENAGRPFRDYYDNILAYGELWGGDDAFSWHPFVNENFVDEDGNVQNFNYDNRELREDFLDAGLLDAFDPQIHSDQWYQQLPGDWKDFVY
jgi:hypothetical protein